MPLTPKRLEALRLKADRRLVKTPPDRVRDACVEILADELYSLTAAADVRNATVEERQTVEDLHVGAINSNSKPRHKVTVCAPDLQLLVRLNTPQLEPPAEPPAATTTAAAPSFGLVHPDDEDPADQTPAE